LFSNGLYLCPQCHDLIHKTDRQYGVTPELVRLSKRPVSSKGLWAEAAIAHMKKCLADGNFPDLEGVE